jgi:hypothetical protein
VLYFPLYRIIGTLGLILDKIPKLNDKKSQNSKKIKSQNLKW